MLAGLRTAPPDLAPAPVAPAPADSRFAEADAVAAAGLATASLDPLDDAALNARAVTKRYGRARPALDRVDLRIEPGECVAIAGVNGAGKTTLLRCLLDFARPDAGSISVFGLDSRDTRARRALAFLPERFLPSPHLTGRETLAMLAALQDQHWSAARIDAALADLEFPREALDTRMRRYSKGMTQKLGLAAAVLQDKPLLVLDEPMSGLDPLARRFLAGVLARLKASGRTLLFTSHAPADIARLADRVALLHAGRLLFAGTPAELCATQHTDDLESAFVARIGHETPEPHDDRPAPGRSLRSLLPWSHAGRST
ncbi:MAG: ABC transporter ATP-binding protein [Burkholderiaceae bacterium]